MTVPTENVRDVLSVRVMRLNRPTLVRQQCEPAELYLDDIAGCLTAADASIRGDLDGIALHLRPTGNIPTSNSDELLNCDNNKLNIDKQNYEFIQPKIGGFSELLGLPHSSRSAYLGETFSAHVNLHNESNQICYNVELKVALHNRTELITLPVSPTLSGVSIPPVLRNSSSSQESSNVRTGINPTNGVDGDGVLDLHPGQSLNAVISHELKELGIHNLRCTVSYFQTNTHGKSEASSHVAAYESPRLTSGLSSRDTVKREPITFQRLYRFSVTKPLDVQKKFSIVDIDRSLLMETQIQNLTATPIVLERVLFEPNPQFSVNDLNNLQFGRKSLSNTTPTYYHYYYLQPNDVQQFVYRLMPTTTNPLPYMNSSTISSLAMSSSLPNPVQVSSMTNHQLSISAGCLDITWRSVMGERGRLQTSPLKYELPTIGDIQLKASSLPPTVTTERPFKMKFELVNCSKTNLDLVLNLQSTQSCMSSIKANSPTNEEEVISSDNKQIFVLNSSVNQTGLPAIVWLGRTRQHLGKLSPGQCIPFELNLMATSPGLHWKQHCSLGGRCIQLTSSQLDETRVLDSTASHYPSFKLFDSLSKMISGVCIHELTMNRDYEFNDLAHVLVFADV
ncbi:unnamed protein product [Heterobilharzia americana]|nr:unnamed protein product [Heterobilharzia americana]